MLLRKTISEFGLIRNADDFAGGTDSFSEIYLPGSSFQQLKTLTGQTEAEGLLTLFWQKGRETLRVRNYVGLLETTDGTQLEVLPKINLSATPKQETPADPDSILVKSARKALLTMLRSLRNSPFRSLPNTHTRPNNLPIWEVFIVAFLDEVERVVGQGLQQLYVPNEANERYWKGKFQLARHLRQNLHHAERLAVAYDKRTPDTPPNRLLKTTLLHLRPRTTTLHLQARLQQVLQAFDDVTPSTNLAADWQKARVTNRLNTRYEASLRWAEAMLHSRVYGLQSGETPTLSLLFPMERVFENYVTHGIRTYWPTGEVSAQESSAHLVEEHIGSPKFRLRPDLIIRQPNRILILDTKWKYINGHDRTGHYGIDSADLYQLFAYGKKYYANDLFLIYPANDTFRAPLDVFGYDPQTRLHVLPFDVTQPIQHEVEKLVQLVFNG